MTDVETPAPQVSGFPGGMPFGAISGARPVRGVSRAWRSTARRRHPGVAELAAAALAGGAAALLFAELLDRVVRRG